MVCCWQCGSAGVGDGDLVLSIGLKTLVVDHRLCLQSKIQKTKEGCAVMCV
jgi:hypothetical protein